MAHIAPRILLLAQEVEEEEKDRKEATFGRLVDPRSLARSPTRPSIRPSRVARRQLHDDDGTLTRHSPPLSPSMRQNRVILALPMSNIPSSRPSIHPSSVSFLPALSD